MAIVNLKRDAEKYLLVKRHLSNQRGAAVVLALLISAAVLAVSAGVMEMSNRSTQISGAGKGYNTASEAADGSIGLVQDAIHYRINGDPIQNVVIDENGNTRQLFVDPGGCFDTALFENRRLCRLQLTLPSSVGADFTAEVSFERLYSQIKEGGRIEFPPSTSGAGNNLAIYYRIAATAIGPKNIRAEKTVLYRLGE